MVIITIDLPEELNKEVEHYLIDNKEKCKNKQGNTDKRVAIINLINGGLKRK